MGEHQPHDVRLRPAPAVCPNMASAGANDHDRRYLVPIERNFISAGYFGETMQYTRRDLLRAGPPAIGIGGVAALSGCQAPTGGYQLTEFEVSAHRTVPTQRYYVGVGGFFTEEVSGVQTGAVVDISEVPRREREALKRYLTEHVGPVPIEEPSTEFVDLVETVDFVHWPEYPDTHKYFGTRLYRVDADEPPILQFDATLDDALVREDSPASLTFELTNVTGTERTVRQAFRAPFNFPTARTDPECEPPRNPSCERQCEGFRLWREEYVEEEYASPTGEWLGGSCFAVAIGDSIRLGERETVERTYTVPSFLPELEPGSYTARNTIGVDNPDRVEVMGYDAEREGAYGALRETLEYTVAFKIAG